MRLFFFLRRPMSLLITLAILGVCYLIIFLIWRSRGKSNKEAHQFTIHSADMVKWILLVAVFVGFIGWAILDSFR